MEREKGATKIVSWKSLWAPGLNYAEMAEWRIPAALEKPKSLLKPKQNKVQKY